MLASGLPDFALDATAQAPTLARLAAESLQFERCYTSCPETGPAQASLITGRFPFALAADPPAITKIVREAGYQSSIVGAWQSASGRSGDPTTAAIDFIKQNRRVPFFVLLAWQRDDASVVDGNARRLLSTLDDLKLAGDTIAVFTSDHGYGSGPLEPAVRIPLMIRHSRVAPGRRSGVLGSTVDLAPTLLALCGFEVNESMQGRNLVRDEPQSIYCAGGFGRPDEWRMLVRGLDKIVLDRSRNATNLYNLGADPLETENHAHDSAYELKRDELTALLSDWMRRTGDGMDPSGLKLR